MGDLSADERRQAQRELAEYDRIKRSAQPLIVTLRELGMLRKREGQVVLHVREDEALDIDVLDRALNNRRYRKLTQGG